MPLYAMAISRMRVPCLKSGFIGTSTTLPDERNRIGSRQASVYLDWGYHQNLSIGYVPSNIGFCPTFLFLPQLGLAMHFKL
jgi:hypothetical protein